MASHLRELADLLAAPANLPAGCQLRFATVVSLPTSRTVKVNLDGVEVTVPRARHYSDASVDDVALLLVQGKTALAWGTVNAPATTSSSTQPAPSQPKPPPPPPEKTTGVRTFAAVSGATYRGGTRRTDTVDLYQGDYTGRGLNLGAWFYGTAPRRTLAGATVTRARIYLARRSGGVYGEAEVRIWLHGAATRTSGTPARGTDSTTVNLRVGESGWYDLPVGFGQAIVNADQRGLCIYQGTASPYVSLWGPANRRASGSLRLNWSK